jgi:hypothetical protein
LADGDSPDLLPGEVGGDRLRRLAAVPEPPASDLDLEVPVTREEMLEAIPLHVVVDDSVDLDTPDPALIADGIDAGRRVCIAARRAGGRCTATVPADSLLCNAHSGRLDPRIGGQALAAKRQRSRDEAEAADRARRLGTRAVIAAVFDREAAKVEATVSTLLSMAAEGDRQAALAVIPYLNQGLGMPTERVVMSEPQSASDLQEMDTAALAEWARQRRLRAAGSTTSG